LRSNPILHLFAAAIAVAVSSAQAFAPSADAAPPFDTAYRAWDVVTDLARRHRQPAISGECGKTFRPFVVPGLRGQSKQEQDRAAVACVGAARMACADAALRLDASIAERCREFR
jgi:hypothetical protein